MTNVHTAGSTHLAGLKAENEILRQALQLIAYDFSSGYIAVEIAREALFSITSKECPRCCGNGQTYDFKSGREGIICPDCNGKGLK